VHKLAQSVLGYIRNNDLIQAGDRVGVAVSGGADSTGLLRLMLELKDELGIVLSVVHLNHMLRGADSDGDEQFVRELSCKHGLEIISESRNAKEHASARKPSLEASARELRYEFFRCALQSDLNRIATAHTLEDQAETVLLKLTRGAGTRGLAGIYPKVTLSPLRSEPCKAAVTDQPLTITRTRTDSLLGNAFEDRPIIRPLLATRRSQLREYVAEIGQDWREDATNQDLRHSRNRIRHEILPRLERELNPSLCEVLAGTAEIARAEEEYWVSETDRLVPDVWHRDASGAYLKRSALNVHPLAVRRRLVRAAAESLGIGLEFGHVQEVLSLEHEGSCAELPEGWIVTCHRDRLEFRKTCNKSENDNFASYEYELSIPGRIAVPEAGIELQTLLLNGSGQTERYSAQDVVDPKLLSHALTVRNWRAGERFWPAHTKEPKKIKELLQDKHIIGTEKALWPVVTTGVATREEVIWVRGFGVRRDLQAGALPGVLIREVKKDQE
jgi:tRNA(Ile)-lysidine synthase